MTQRPLLTHGLLGVVGPHHYHMNAVGWYRLGDPCYREYLRRVREEHAEEPFDVSQHRCESGLILTTTYRSYGRSICTNPHLILNRFLHDRAHFRIFQEWAHKFVYLLRRRSSHAIQTPSLCLWFWGVCLWRIHASEQVHGCAAELDRRVGREGGGSRESEYGHRARERAGGQMNSERFIINRGLPAATHSPPPAPPASAIPVPARTRCERCCCPP